MTLILTALIGGIGLAQGKDTFLMVEAAIALADRGDPGRAADRGDARTRARHVAHGATECADRAPVGRRDPRCHDRHPHRQDRNPHGKPHDGPEGVASIGRVRRRTRLGLKPRTKRGQVHPIQNLQLERLLEIAVFCNNATLGRVSDEDTGDPMELALLRAGRLAGLERGELLNKSPEIVEHAFDTTTKMMATVHRSDGAYLFAIKGAPEAVLAKANASRAKTVMPLWMKRRERSGSRGSTSLALRAACARVRGAQDAAPDGPPFESLTFLGLVGLEDPPRADVPDAIRACHEAGIRVVMITGDHAVTARSIARAVGLGGAGAARHRRS